jgi:transposase
VALETVGNWYWIADEIEAAGCLPLLTHAAKAKVMMGHVDKTDKLDACGLATLLRNGTLPTVWLPPGPVRDQRELPRTRIALSRIRTAIKNRLDATLAKYALSPEGTTDLFSKKGMSWLEGALSSLPPETSRCAKQELELLNALNDQIETLEDRIRQQIQTTPNLRLLKTLPGVGNILAIVIDREMGSIDRFHGPESFACYSGTAPKVSSSGGKTHYGRMRQPVRRQTGRPTNTSSPLSSRPATWLLPTRPRRVGPPSTSPDSTIASEGRRATRSPLAR